MEASPHSSTAFGGLELSNEQISKAFEVLQQRLPPGACEASRLTQGLHTGRISVQDLQQILSVPQPPAPGPSEEDDDDDASQISLDSFAAPAFDDSNYSLPASLPLDLMDTAPPLPQPLGVTGVEPAPPPSSPPPPPQVTQLQSICAAQAQLLAATEDVLQDCLRRLQGRAPVQASRLLDQIRAYNLGASAARVSYDSSLAGPHPQLRAHPQMRTHPQMRNPAEPAKSSQPARQAVLSPTLQKQSKHLKDRSFVSAVKTTAHSLARTSGNLPRKCVQDARMAPQSMRAAPPDPQLTFYLVPVDWPRWEPIDVQEYGMTLQSLLSQDPKCSGLRISSVRHLPRGKVKVSCFSDSTLSSGFNISQFLSSSPPLVVGRYGSWQVSPPVQPHSSFVLSGVSPFLSEVQVEALLRSSNKLFVAPVPIKVFRIPVKGSSASDTSTLANRSDACVITTAPAVALSVLLAGRIPLGYSTVAVRPDRRISIRCTLCEAHGHTVEECRSRKARQLRSRLHLAPNAPLTQDLVPGRGE